MNSKTILFLFASTFVIACSHSDMEIDAISPSNPEPTSRKFLSADEVAILASEFMRSLHDEELTTRFDQELGKASVKLLETRALTKSEIPDTIFYAVDFENGGFTLVAAERDLYNNVYAYSTSGSFEIADNPVMEIFLDNAISTLPDAHKRTDYELKNYNTRALTLPDPDIPAYDEREINGVMCRGFYKNSHTIKQPLLSTLWHQKYPYNISCPTINGDTTPVGCVAVAIGQICAYQKKPAKLDGSSLDWDNMLRFSRHKDEFEDGLYQVADFLHSIGLKVNMNYDIKGSGATYEDSFEGLKKLGFTSAKKDGFNPTTCVDILKTNEPILMFGISLRGGHSWVIDGYDNMDTWVEYYRIDNGDFYARYSGFGYTYLHFNCGWDDTESNTYYLCYGAGEVNDNYKNFSVFEFSNDNKTITGIR